MEDSVFTHDLEYVEAFMAEAERVHRRIAQNQLRPLGFVPVTNRSDDRLLLGPDSAVYTVRHGLCVWNSPALGRLTWFFLDSQIPHVSSIVACIGIPQALTSLPLFVMNLNLKLRLRSYNTIIGFRGHAEGLRRLAHFAPELGPADPRYELSKDPPVGFAGVRSMFMLSMPPIRWSLEVAESSLAAWFEDLQTPSTGAADPSDGQVHLDLYKQEMLDLHAREGHVFDAIFGPNWLSNIFREQVFV